MSDLLFSLGHAVSVATIAIGLGIAVWHVWNLASKLGRHRTDRAAVSLPPKSRMRGDDGRPSL